MSNEQKNKIESFALSLTDHSKDSLILKSMIFKLINEVCKYDVDFLNKMHNCYEGMNTYNNYLSEEESSSILDNFINYDGSRGAMFKNISQLETMLNNLGLHMEQAPNYNKWAMYVTMNKFASDQGRVIKNLSNDDKNTFVKICYDMSEALLADADRPRWVRHYFNL